MFLNQEKPEMDNFVEKKTFVLKGKKNLNIFQNILCIFFLYPEKKLAFFSGRGGG